LLAIMLTLRKDISAMLEFLSHSRLRSKIQENF